MCRKERNSCCKPNPYSLIFHHLGTSSTVFCITASAFYSAVVSESKFLTKTAIFTCQVHLYLTWTLKAHTPHHPAEAGAWDRWYSYLTKACRICLLAAACFKGNRRPPSAIFPSGSTRSNFSSLASNWCSEFYSDLTTWQKFWTLECPGYTQKLTDSAAEDYLLLLLQWSHSWLIFFPASFWMYAQIHRCAQEVDGTRGALKHLSCYFTLPPRCY